MSKRVESVAVLGTGIMGRAIARNLAKAGLEVSAWNRSREKAESLTEDGVAVADTAAEAVRERDAVLTTLSDGDAVAEVISEARDAISNETIWIQSSTVGLEPTGQLVSLAHEIGVAYIDAPVLGTKAPAEAGELIVLASGPEAAIDACEPVFEAIGARTVRLGKEGASTRMKLVLNNWLLTLTANLAETLALAEELGLEASKFLEIIEGGPIDAGYAQLKGKAMIERDFATSFPLYLALKDARLVSDAAESAELEMVLGEAVLGRFADADEQGHGEQDMAAVYEAISKREDDRPAAEP